MFRVAIPVANATTWSQVKGVIQSGDFVWLRANSTNLAGSIALGQQIAADVPGVHVVFFDRVGGLNSVSTMDAYLTATPLPSEIDYVGYDFEPTYQPEFTFVESVAPRYMRPSFFHFRCPNNTSFLDVFLTDTRFRKPFPAPDSSSLRLTPHHSSQSSGFAQTLAGMGLSEPE